jgi:hypothetical protein
MLIMKLTVKSPKVRTKSQLLKASPMFANSHTHVSDPKLNNGGNSLTLFSNAKKRTECLSSFLEFIFYVGRTQVVRGVKSA